MELSSWLRKKDKIKLLNAAFSSSTKYARSLSQKYENSEIFYYHIKKVPEFLSSENDTLMFLFQFLSVRKSSKSAHIKLEWCFISEQNYSLNLYWRSA